MFSSSSSNVVTNISDLLFADEWNTNYRVLNGDEEATNQVVSITNRIRDFFQPAPSKIPDDDDDDEMELMQNSSSSSSSITQTTTNDNDIDNNEEEKEELEDITDATLQNYIKDSFDECKFKCCSQKCLIMQKRLEFQIF